MIYLLHFGENWCRKNLKLKMKGEDNITSFMCKYSIWAVEKQLRQNKIIML